MRAEELSHVCLPSVDLDGILHQTIHDGIGVGISTEQNVPFLQGMLGAKKRGALPVAPLHQVKQEMRLVGTDGAGCPFINDEKMVLAETVQESRATAGCLGSHCRLLQQLRQADIKDTLSVAANCLPNGTTQKCFAGSCEARNCARFHRQDKHCRRPSAAHIDL